MNDKIRSLRQEVTDLRIRQLKLADSSEQIAVNANHRADRIAKLLDLEQQLTWYIENMRAEKISPRFAYGKHRGGIMGWDEKILDIWGPCANLGVQEDLNLIGHHLILAAEEVHRAVLQSLQNELKKDKD